MAIKAVHALFAALLIIGFYQLPQDVWNVDLNIEWIPVPFNVIFAILLVPLAFVIVLGPVAFVGVAIIHLSWVVYGAWCLSRSRKRTWRDASKYEIFDSNKPCWREGHRRSPSEAQPGGSENTLKNPVAIEAGFYQTLDTNTRKDIRLLRPVLDEADSGTICFELMQIPLPSARQKYAALSYCGGTGNPTAKIRVRPIPGMSTPDQPPDPTARYRDVMIRPNLYQALSRLTDSAHVKEFLGDERLLWIDAICINQADDKELGAQVARMLTIFKDARVVFAWFFDIKANPEVPQADTSGSTSSQLPGGQALPNRAVEALLRDPYWARTWIIQEYAVNKRLKLLTDVDSFTESEVSSSLKSVDRKTSAQVKIVMDLRSEVERHQRPSLLDLLIRTSDSLSTRKLDRVFGLWSLARDKEKYLSEPNYVQTSEEISKQMTRDYLDTADCCLDLILLGAHFKNRSDLPSWCPDYFGFDRLPADRRLFEYVRDAIGPPQSSPQNQELGLRFPPLFEANGDRGCEVSFDDQGTVLKTSGYFVGRINSLGWVEADQNTEAYPTEDARQTFEPSGSETAMALWSLLSTLCQRVYSEAYLHREAPSAADEMTKSDYKTCMSPYIYFMVLAFGGDLPADAKDESVGWYTQWLHNNRNFFFGQRALRAHAKKTRVLAQRGFWKWGASVLHTLQASIRHRELRDLNRIHQPLKMVAQQQMRLMSMTGAHKNVLGLAHPSAQKDDEIFLLPGCSTPVILRRATLGEENGPYRVVGDAIVPGLMFVKQWTDEMNHDLQDVEIV